MPFRKKPTGLKKPGVPEEVDFDALWERVFEPAIRAAGLQPVRADEETGPLIIHEMIESLALADVVLADVSIANANVYYEIGVRHGFPVEHDCCLMVAADWVEPVFDLKQIRTQQYPLPDGSVPEADAAVARALVESWLRNTALGRSPVRSIMATTAGDKHARVAQFVERARLVNEATSRMRAVRLLPKAERNEAARLLQEELVATPSLVPAVRLELLKLVRDCRTWADVLQFIDASLTPEQQAHPWVQEQRLLAIGKAGDPLAAIAALETLIREHGGTSERYGLIGGRAKKLWAANGPDADRWLDRAIDAYTDGMLADLNDYFPSCNLPRLLKRRDLEGDTAAAEKAYAVAFVACQRALRRESYPGEDEWLRPTLLGLAFDAGDLPGARRLARQVRNEGPAVWKLETTLHDLEVSARAAPEAVRPGFETIIADLRSLL